MFWILSIVLTVAVTAAIARPLVQSRGLETVADGGRDVEVYAAQLTELDADLRRGTIRPEDAATARAEIGRRLLKAAASGREGSGTAERRFPVLAGILLAFGLPAAGLALYTQLGSPARADLPLAARGDERVADAADGGDLRAMVAAAETRLAQNPQDGRGWDVLAPIYARLGDLDRARTAYENALRLLGDTPERLSGYGEVLVRAGGGEVGDAARDAFARAQKLDPGALTPRLFLALDMTQEGRSAEAAAAWRSVLADAPADAPWRAMAQAALAEAEGGAPAGGGPSQAEVAARATANADGDQAAMIEGMVAGLAARLQAEPDDAQGWTRLVHAYGVLGDEARGQAALAQARRHFPASTEEWARIADTAARAGLVVSSESRP